MRVALLGERNARRDIAARWTFGKLVIDPQLLMSLDVRVREIVWNSVVYRVELWGCELDRPDDSLSTFYEGCDGALVA